MARPRSQPSLDQDFLDGCADLGDTRLRNYKLYEDYYDGDQLTKLTDRTKKYLEQHGIRFCENFCEPVVDVMAERLIVTGFAAEDKGAGQTSGETDDRDELADYLAAVFDRNRFAEKQLTVHTVALVQGDAFIVVDWDAGHGIPRLTVNRPELCKPVYSPDEPDTLAYLAKRWNSAAVGPENPAGRTVVRLNVYRPDRVEKYFRAGSNDGEGGWARWRDDGDTGWPTPWTDSQGQPFGIPVFHFRHKPLGRPYGRSELRSVIPQQDSLNKQIVDLHDILDYQAWKQRWISGANDTTNLTPAPGTYLTLPADAATGEFSAEDPAGVLSSIEDSISRIARRSRTPLHLLVGGDTPSGEALKSAEAGLVAKVGRAQTTFGCVWEDAAMLALRLASDQGKLPAPPVFADLVLRSVWKSAESRMELAESQALQIQVESLGLSHRSALRQLGYDPSQEEELRAAEQATLDGAAGRLLDGGAAAGDGATAVGQQGDGMMAARAAAGTVAP